MDIEKVRKLITRWAEALEDEYGHLIEAGPTDDSDDPIIYPNEQKASDMDRLSFGGPLTAVKSADGLTATISGPCLFYGDPNTQDVTGQHFSADTYLGQSGGNGVDATFNHRLDMPIQTADPAIKSIFAGLKSHRYRNPVEVTSTDYGKAASLILDLADEYEKFTYELASKGALRWSAGSTQRMISVAKNGHILEFPVIEWGLTPYPAEPRLPRIAPVQAFKNALAGAMVEIKPAPTDDDTDDPEDTAEAAQASAADGDQRSGESIDSEAAADEDAGGTLADDTATNEVLDMDEKEKETTPVNGDDMVTMTKADLDTAVGSAVKSAVDKFKADYPAPTGGGFANINTVTQPGFADEDVKAFAAYVYGQADDPNRRDAIKAALQVNTAAEGGYLVPEVITNRIASKRSEQSLVDLLPVDLHTTSKTDIYHLPFEDTAMTGLVKTAEEAAYNDNAPTFEDAAVTIQKWTKRILFSEELEADNVVGLTSWLGNSIGRAVALAENAEIVAKLLAASGTQTVTFAGTGAIATSEVPEMYYKVPDGYDPNGWLMLRATLGAIMGITGDNFQFVNTPQGSNAQTPMLWGAPVATASSMAAMAASAKSAIVGDWNNVAWVRNGNLSVRRNDQLYMNTGQIALFYNIRGGCAVTQPEAFVIGTHAAS